MSDTPRTDAALENKADYTGDAFVKFVKDLERECVQAHKMACQARLDADKLQAECERLRAELEAFRRGVPTSSQADELEKTKAECERLRSGWQNSANDPDVQEAVIAKLNLVHQDALDAASTECERLRSELSHRLVDYCVCANMESPVEGCSCVSCTIKRLEQKLSAANADAERLIAAALEAGHSQVITEFNSFCPMCQALSTHDARVKGATT